MSVQWGVVVQVLCNSLLYKETLLKIITTAKLKLEQWPQIHVGKFLSGSFEFHKNISIVSIPIIIKYNKTLSVAVLVQTTSLMVPCSG